MQTCDTYDLLKLTGAGVTQQSLVFSFIACNQNVYYLYCLFIVGC